MKKFLLIAGVNGVGKSTMYSSKEFPEGIQDSVRINTDEIVREFGDWKDSVDQIKAAKIAIQMREDCFREGKTFHEESTLCGKSILRQIDRAKTLGYETYLYYIGVSSPEISKERIRNRVEKGGHFIPDEVVEKRYFESIRNLEEHLNKFDNIMLFDNSNYFKLCYSYSRKDELHFVSKDYPTWLEKAILGHRTGNLIEENEKLFVYSPKKKK